MTAKKYIAEVRSYITEAGNRIEQHVPVSGALPEGSPTFWGHGGIVMRVANPPVEAQRSFRFPFPAHVLTLEAAAAEFERAAKSYSKAIVEPELVKELRAACGQQPAQDGIQLASAEALRHLGKVQ